LLFELFPDALRQRRTASRGGNRYLKIATLDDGRIVKVAVLGIINGVTQDAALTGFLEDGVRKLTSRNRGNDQKHAIKIVGLEPLLDPGKPFRRSPRSDAIRCRRRHHPHIRVSRKQAGDFRLADSPCANNQAGASGELDEQREQRHSVQLCALEFGL
jgi:hypothetical protein